MKGWFGEPTRHSLAARGISTRARALVKPSGRWDPRIIEHTHRTYRSIDELSQELKKGVIDNPVNGIRGGITVSREEGPSVETHGSIFLEFEPDELLLSNDLIKIDYDPDFLRSNIDISKRIEPTLKKSRLTDSDVSTLMAYEDEQELVSRDPIKIPPWTIKRIIIRYGGGVYNPITGEWMDYEEIDEKESWELGREIIKEVRGKIPEMYWNDVYLENITTGEEQMLRWLI